MEGNPDSGNRSRFKAHGAGAGRERGVIILLLEATYKFCQSKLLLALDFLEGVRTFETRTRASRVF